MARLSRSPRKNPRTLEVSEGAADLEFDLESFLIDRQARGLSPRTISFYRDKLDVLLGFLKAQQVQEVRDISPDLLRRFLLAESEHRTPGGVHALYRSLRAFLRWWQAELEPDGWRNPIERVPAPKVPEQPLEPVPMADLRKMLATCERGFYGDRDRCILLALLDTGCRRGEFAALNLGDVNLQSGSVTVREGKGGKVRTTFLGQKCRRAMTRYIRHRRTSLPGDAIWVTLQGTRLSYGGLREVVRRRARRAGVPEPSLHAFRRAFAIGMLRSGADLVTLQRLLGHADLSILQRYLKQTDADLKRLHEQSSPVDRMLGQLRVAIGKGTIQAKKKRPRR